MQHIGVPLQRDLVVSILLQHLLRHKDFKQALKVFFFHYHLDLVFDMIMKNLTTSLLLIAEFEKKYSSLGMLIKEKNK